MEGFEELDRELDERELRSRLRNNRALYTMAQTELVVLRSLRPSEDPAIAAEFAEMKRSFLRYQKEADARVREIEAAMREYGFAIPRWRSREETERRYQVLGDGTLKRKVQPTESETELVGLLKNLKNEKEER